jgi:predicted nuclease of predicted toxin-antitoxin system
MSQLSNMKFKIDENLPIDVAYRLQLEGHDAVTVGDQQLGGEADSILADVCKQEKRVMITLDLDFADIRTYPPGDYPGLIVLRLRRQDKPYVLSVFEQLLSALKHDSLENSLWIVDEQRIRIHV